jgi:hypothetical protein
MEKRNVIDTATPAETSKSAEAVDIGASMFKPEVKNATTDTGTDAGSIQPGRDVQVRGAGDKAQ